MGRKGTTFDSKYTEEPNTGCWLWTGAINSSGYGNVRYNGKVDGAHRISYLLYKGPIVHNLNVLHTCDNPCCVNPDHLFLGTAKDNVLDCKSKGRLNRIGPKGENQHMAVLTEDLVRWIRTRPMSYRKMARYLHVNKNTIQDVLMWRTWKHVIS